MPEKYRVGDTDALVRQTRGYLKLLDGKEPPGRKHVYLAIIADNFERLDAFLSEGRPFPTMWCKGVQRNVDLAGSEDTEAPGRQADSQTVRSERESV